MSVCNLHWSRTPVSLYLPSARIIDIYCRNWLKGGGFERLFELKAIDGERFGDYYH